MVLANGGGDQPASLPGQASNLQTQSIEVPINSPDTPVSYSVQNQGMINEEMLKLQEKIDKYLFEDHFEEISKKGFEVTHTGPFDNYVEIGITPYSEENATYLYDIFGEDKVKVAEGQQAQLYSTSVASDNMEIAITAVNENQQTSKSNSFKNPLMYTLGGLILGGSIIVNRKLKLVK